MSLKKLLVALILLIMVTPVLQAQNTEQELVNKFFERNKTKHTYKTAWLSVHFSMNRINRNNQYNSFATHTSEQLTNGDLNWLNIAPAFGINFGMLFKERFSWSLGGEYWLKIGEELSGDIEYLATGTTIENPSSEIKVLGFYTDLQYYFLNHPKKLEHLKGLALRAGGSIGYYMVNWDLWPEYQNLNLATGEPTAMENTTFKGSAPGFKVTMGADYPINVFNLVIGADLSYLYLNFNNVAWYNDSDEEIIVTYTGTPEGRVDLNLSGFIGKIELKRFFSW
ncbi:MAG: hypothetical protein PHU88_08905 [candidate division Zixibacteria bacterium]|nr:hypothetical protein [candidate division Zixibacteria bacterium]MDD5426906.1 hypothetical protein [candidate division Zixibacteria bacterium]